MCHLRKQKLISRAPLPSSSFASSPLSFSPRLAVASSNWARSVVSFPCGVWGRAPPPSAKALGSTANASGVKHSGSSCAAQNVHRNKKSSNALSFFSLQNLQSVKILQPYAIMQLSCLLIHNPDNIGSFHFLDHSFCSAESLRSVYSQGSRSKFILIIVSIYMSSNIYYYY